MIRPLLKWAGGKRQLLPILRPYYPDRFTRYVEPFFGSGAVFFDLYAMGRLKGRQAWLVDDNVDLMGCYFAVCRYVERVIDMLAELEAGHRDGGDAHFYEVRDGRFNRERQRFLAHRDAKRYTAELAAMLIYLNRTGFNGLFRLNARGAFNVPVGRYTNPRICEPAHLREVARALSAPGVHLIHGPFDQALAGCGRGDLVYCDPPYAPISATSRFTSYTASGFTAADQSRLQQSLIAASRRGAQVLLSNSTAPLIRQLYTSSDAKRANLRTRRISARRSINSRASARGPVQEFLITNLSSA